MKLNIKEEYNHLFNVISSERFQKCQGIGNEIPFFICSYDVSRSLDFENIRLKLIKNLELKEINILDINLYDISIEILNERGIFERIIELENEITKDELLELLQGVLDTEEHLIPKVKEKMNDFNFDTLFISGVGEVFPYIRSHNILNNLQSHVNGKPTVMFFPGKYQFSIEDGTSLDLFGKLHDDKYYRAFDIFQYESRKEISCI